MDVLQRHGIAFDCFEQSERVGGHWHTDSPWDQEICKATQL